MSGNLLIIFNHPFIARVKHTDTMFTMSRSPQRKILSLPLLSEQQRNTETIVPDETEEQKILAVKRVGLLNGWHFFVLLTYLFSSNHQPEKTLGPVGFHVTTETLLWLFSVPSSHYPTGTTGIPVEFSLEPVSITMTTVLVLGHHF